MRLLLDTHAVLWWADDSRSLSKRARMAIGDPQNECLVSVASCWEIAIKLSLEKLRIDAPIGRFLPELFAANAFRQLSIDFRHVVRVARLPFHHRDPFDRLLAAQACEENLTIVSADPVFRKYGLKRIW